MNAIVPDSDATDKYIKLNAEYAPLWPNITRKKAAPADADAWKDKPDKDALFSPEPFKK